MLSEKEALSQNESDELDQDLEYKPKDDQEKKANAGIVEPIARSKVLIGLQMAATVVLLEGVYALAVGFASSWITPDTMTGVFIALGLIQVAKAVILGYLLIYILLTWAATDYYIAGHHLVIHTGIVNTDEKVYELKHIRRVEVKQSWLGHFLNYGDLCVVVAQSGVREDIHMIGVAAPSKYEEIFEHFLETE